MKNKEKNNIFFSSSIFSKSRKGWMKVVEAFLAVLVIGLIILLIVNQNSSSDDVSPAIYQDELAMLRAVQLNDSLREKVVEAAGLPLNLNDPGFPPEVKAALEQRNPGYLDCDAKICALNAECVIQNENDEDIYVSQVTIFADYQKYDPKKLLLSCVVING